MNRKNVRPERARLHIDQVDPGEVERDDRSAMAVRGEIEIVEAEDVRRADQDCVVLGPAKIVDRVRPARAGEREHVGPCAAVELVVARPADECVVARTGPDDVIAVVIDDPLAEVVTAQRVGVAGREAVRGEVDGRGSAAPP